MQMQDILVLSFDAFLAGEHLDLCPELSTGYCKFDLSDDETDEVSFTCGFMIFAFYE